MRIIGVRIPYVITLQEGDPFERVFERPHIMLFKPLLTYGIKNATVVQTISTFLAEWVKRMGFTGPLEVVPNAVDTKHFMKEYSSEELFALKQKLGKSPEDTYLITTSRLVHKNGIDNVIQSLKNLPTDIEFLVLGSGPERTNLVALSQELGVADRVKFLGHVPHDELPKYLKISDIFIRPSRSEGFGNSFVEAMAAELPVITTQEGGIADFLFDEKRNPEKPTTGWAVDAESPEQISEAVRDIASNPEKVKKVIVNAKNMAIEKYDWNLIAKDMREKVFNNLFGTPTSK